MVKCNNLGSTTLFQPWSNYGELTKVRPWLNHGMTTIDYLSFARKDAGSQSQIFVLFATAYDEQITVRFCLCVYICFRDEATVVWVQLSCQVCELTVISWIFKEHHVLSI